MTPLSENSGSLLLPAWVWHVVSHWFTGSSERRIIRRVQKDRGAFCRFPSVTDSGIRQQVMNPVRLSGSARQRIQSC